MKATKEAKEAYLAACGDLAPEKTDCPTCGFPHPGPRGNECEVVVYYRRDCWICGEQYVVKERMATGEPVSEPHRCNPTKELIQ